MSLLEGFSMNLHKISDLDGQNMPSYWYILITWIKLKLKTLNFMLVPWNRRYIDCFKQVNNYEYLEIIHRMVKRSKYTNVISK